MNMEDAVSACIRAVKAGQLVILPTDTVYGIGTDPYNEGAIAALLQAKGRGESKPPPVLASSPEQALQMGSFANVEQLDKARRLAEAFWPGPLTLIIPTEEKFGWNMSVLGATVAVRVPGHQLTRSVLAETGPLAVTSANLTGMPPALTVSHACGYFPGVVALDGGPAELGAASTIIDVTSGRVIRPGALDLGLIEEVMG